MSSGLRVLKMVHLCQLVNRFTSVLLAVVARLEMAGHIRALEARERPRRPGKAPRPPFRAGL
ncbi:MAG: hypothetical protein ACP5VR_11190 [Acidimicrobiales bacterium]